MSFILKWLSNFIAVACAAWLVGGIYVWGYETTMGNAWLALLLFALVLTLVNATIKPILQILSAPITLLTLGLFYLVVNALVLELSSWLCLSLLHFGVYVQGFWSAFIGAIIISVIGVIVDSVIGNSR